MRLPQHIRRRFLFTFIRRIGLSRASRMPGKSSSTGCSHHTTSSTPMLRFDAQRLTCLRTSRRSTLGDSHAVAYDRDAAGKRAAPLPTTGTLPQLEREQKMQTTGKARTSRSTRSVLAPPRSSTGNSGSRTCGPSVRRGKKHRPYPDIQSGDDAPASSPDHQHTPPWARYPPAPSV